MTEITNLDVLISKCEVLENRINERTIYSTFTTFTGQEMKTIITALKNYKLEQEHE